MGSCSSKPGEVGAMPQQGSGSAAPLNAEAIEAVRASASALHPRPTSPDRPVSPGYDRRVVSHDASKRPPGGTRGVAPEPPSRRGDAFAAPSANHLPAGGRAGARPGPGPGPGPGPPPRRDLDALRDPNDAFDEEDDLSPRTPGGGPLTLRRAREIRSAEDAERRRERERLLSAPSSDVDTARAAPLPSESDGVLLYSVDGTVSVARLPPPNPNPNPNPGLTLKRPGTRGTLGGAHRGRPMSRGFVSSTRPATEPGGARDVSAGRRVAPRLTAAEVMGAVTGRGDPGDPRTPSDAESDEALGSDAELAPGNGAFPAAGPPGSLSDDDASDFSEPEETLAMARERARYEEGVGLDDEEGLAGDEERDDRERAPGTRARLRIAALEGPPKPRPVSREEAPREEAPRREPERERRRRKNPKPSRRWRRSSRCGACRSRATTTTRRRRRRRFSPRREGRRLTRRIRRKGWAVRRGRRARRLRRPPRGAPRRPRWIGSFRSSPKPSETRNPSSEPSRNLSPNRPRTGERVEMMTAAATTFPSRRRRLRTRAPRRDPRRRSRTARSGPAASAAAATPSAPRRTRLGRRRRRSSPRVAPRRTSGTSGLDRCSSPPPCPSPFERTRRSRGRNLPRMKTRRWARRRPPGPGPGRRRRRSRATARRTTRGRRRRSRRCEGR